MKNTRNSKNIIRKKIPLTEVGALCISGVAESEFANLFESPHQVFFLISKNGLK